MRQKMVADLSLKQRGMLSTAKVNMDQHLEASKALFPLTHREDDAVFPINERDSVSPDEKYDNKLLFYE